DFDELLPPEPEPARPAPVPFSPSRPRTDGRDDPMGRARLYARRLPPAIEGQHGDNDTFRAACKLFRGFDLSDEDAFIILNDEWNSRCQPPWSEAELREKIRNAARYGHEPIGEKLNASKPPPASNNNGKTRPFLKEEPVVEPADQWHVPSHWKRLDLADLHEWQCEPLVPLIDGIIARGNLVYVAAETQTGKTLLGLYIARKLLQVGKLFEKHSITPIDRLLYLVLEDPDRRAKDRLLDTDHEFVEPVDRERCIFHIAPGFNLSDSKMFTWMEQVITSERREVVFLDTYQKA